MMSKSCFSSKILQTLFAILIFIQVSTCQEEPKKKILVATVIEGSHIRQMVKAIKELALTDRYNISMLFLEGSHYDKGFEGLDFHPIYVKNYTQEHLDTIVEYFKVTPDVPINLQIELLMELLNFTQKDSELLQFLKDQRYDLFLTEQIGHFHVLQQLLRIPKHFEVILDTIDPWIVNDLGYSGMHSAEYSMSTSMIFGTQPQDSLKSRFSYFQRLRNQLGNYLIYVITKYVWRPIMEKFMHPEQTHFVYEVKDPDFILAKGIEGLTTQISLPPNIRLAYPLIKSKQDSQAEELSETLTQFLEKSQTVFLISFGTTFLPSHELLSSIFSYILTNSDYNYIITFQEKYVSSDLVKMIQGKDNIYNSNWIPQKQLLMNEKVKVFFTHGGYNSFLETIETGTAAISYPLAQNDQQRFCELFQELQLGQCLTQISFESIHTALKIIESNDFYKEYLNQAMRVIERKKEEGEDLAYWVDYVFRVDTEAIHPEQYNYLNLFQTMDLDIKLCVIVPLLLMRFALMGLCKKYCCKKRQDKS